MKKRVKKGAFLLFALIAATILGLSGGDFNLTSEEQGSVAHIFAVDSKNGNIYEIGDDGTAATRPLASIGQNSSGEIVFSGDKGFVAVGNYDNTDPGLYFFDAAAPSPSASKIGVKTSAQYICIASDTRGYVSSADFNKVYADAVYPFNPAVPSAGFGAAITGFLDEFYPQDLISAFGRLYVTDNKNGKVYKINEAGTAVEATFTTTKGGTTGLLAGEFDYDNDGDDDPGIFIANTGGYDAEWHALPGSIDFIPFGAADGSAAHEVLSPISVGRLVFLDNSLLVATGYSKTYTIDLSAASPAATEVKYSGASFGSNDVNVKDGYAYVPDGANAVYRFSGTGHNILKIAVGKTGEMVSNIGIRP
jgi:hypothetical protein